MKQLPDISGFHTLFIRPKINGLPFQDPSYHHPVTVTLFCPPSSITHTDIVGDKRVVFEDIPCTDSHIVSGDWPLFENPGSKPFPSGRPCNSLPPSVDRSGYLKRGFTRTTVQPRTGWTRIQNRKTVKQKIEWLPKVERVEIFTPLIFPMVIGTVTGIKQFLSIVIV